MPLFNATYPVLECLKTCNSFVRFISIKRVFYKTGVCIEYCMHLQQDMYALYEVYTLEKPQQDFKNDIILECE